MEQTSLFRPQYHFIRIGFLEKQDPKKGYFEIKNLDGKTHKWENARFINLTRLFDKIEGHKDILAQVQKLLEQLDTTDS